MLIGGLGRAIRCGRRLDHPGWGKIVVVEAEPSIIEWNTQPAR